MSKTVVSLKIPGEEVYHVTQMLAVLLALRQIQAKYLKEVSR